MSYMSKKRLLLACATLTLAFVPWHAQAISVDIFNTVNEQGKINDWISALGGQTIVVENFEGFDSSAIAIGWYQTLNTAVGEFSSDGALIGTGSSSHNAKMPDSDLPWFELRDYNANGRYDYTTGTGQYLDSADITKLTLHVEANTFNNLFFYLYDPSDVSADTEASAEQGSLTGSAQVDYQQNNGALFFVGINADTDFIDTITLTASTTGDGFSVDDFSRVAPVPEPATMLLLGTGLIGLAGAARRKKKK